MTDVTTKSYAIGIDLGGTKIEVAIVNSEGTLIDRLRVPTEKEKGTEAIINNIAKAVTYLTGKHPDVTIAAVGAGVAGQIDRETGEVIYAPNLNWKNIPLQQQLQEQTGKPVVVVNDVKAAMWGEWRYGAGQGSRDVVCLFVGTGIGSGIVLNDHILHGINNTAGEVGHMTIDLNGPVCHCGNRGCFEALAGGWAIGRDVKDAVRKDPVAGAALLQAANGDEAALDAHALATAYEKGDTLAKQLVANLGRALVAGTVSIVNAFGTERLILGGGIMEGFPHLLDAVKEGVNKYALKAAVAQLQIVPATLHNEAGVIGAATLALHELKKQNQL